MMLRVTLTVVIATALLTGCSKTQAARGNARAEKVRTVKTEAVRQEAVRRAVEVVGTLAAEEQVIISSQADGVVSRVLVDLGDHVKAGQALIELDREKLEYNLDQQRAALVRALARYGAIEPGHLPPIEQTPDVLRTAAELGQAKQAFERATELHKRQLVPKQTLDDAEATLRAKNAIYDSALQNAKDLAGEIDAANAMLKLADRQLRDTSIRAPFDGYVQKRLVSLGELLKSQTPVISLVRVDTLKALAEIPERMAPWIKVGQTVEISIDAFPDKTIAGTVSRISPAVDASTRAFPFEAYVPNGDGRLKPGTFARVHVSTALVEQVLTIPYGAMQYRYGIYRAFVVSGDKLAVRELQTGDRLGERMEILGGVKLGESIALTDVDNLADGMAVNVGRQTE